MLENKNQEQIKSELENKYKEEIQKLKDKIIELQDLIITKDKEISEGIGHYVKLSSEYSEKDNKTYELERKITKIKAVMARQWKVPMENVEAMLTDKLKELGVN